MKYYIILIISIITLIVIFLPEYPNYKYIDTYFKNIDPYYQNCTLNCNNLKTKCKITNKTKEIYLNPEEFKYDYLTNSCQREKKIIWYINPLNQKEKIYRLFTNTIFKKNYTEQIVDCYWDKEHIPNLNCDCMPIYDLIRFLICLICQFGIFMPLGQIIKNGF